MQPVGKNLRYAYVIHVILGDVLTFVLTFAIAVGF